MKECFWDGLHLGKQNKQKLEQVGKIIEHYAAQGYRLTLRQLYYQLCITSGNSEQSQRICEIE